MCQDFTILNIKDLYFLSLKPLDHVVALHPRYVYSYAPATVREVYNFGVKVHFYDDMERKLPWSEVYKISPVKYKESVDYIKEREEKTCGRVVARDDVTGLYRPCKFYSTLFVCLKNRPRNRN